MPSDFWMSLSGKAKVLMGSSVVRDTVLTPPSEVVASWHYSGQILRFVFQSPIPVVSLTTRAHAWTHTRISYYRTRSLHAQGQQRTLTVSYRVVDPIDGLHFSVPDERCVVGGRSFCGLSSCLASCPIFRLLGVRLIIPQLSEAAARGGLGQRD